MLRYAQCNCNQPHTKGRYLTIATVEVNPGDSSKGKQSLRRHLFYTHKRFKSVPLFILLNVLLFIASCEKQDSAVIDSSSFVPRLTSVVIHPSSINTDTINVGSERKPDDDLALRVKTYAVVAPDTDWREIKSVQAKLLRETGLSKITVAELRDDGADVDSTKGDGVFSGWINFSIKRSEVGNYRVEVYAESAGGFTSVAIIQTLQILRLNRPPVLSDLRAPDTVRTSTQTSFLITVRASDPDGLADIRSVTRTTPSNLVLQLNDSGVNGDAVAGDGIFSELVSLAPPPPLGSYQFRFQAFDRSNAGSNVILHTITVVQ